MSASLSNDEIEDRFFLLGRMEILNILNDLIHRREPVTVYFNGGNEFILSLLLEARAEALIFDLGGDERANKLLEKAASCTFLALPDGIRVQFSGIEPNRFLWGDKDAFWVPLPERIVRLQRRESYRNSLPVVNPLRVKLLMEEDSQLYDLALHDLSVGGFAATVYGETPLRSDDKIAQLEIQLSDKNTLICPGQIRHVTLVSRDGNGRYRIGVKFLNLPHVMEVAIQRFIIKTEYERRKLLML